MIVKLASLTFDYDGGSALHIRKDRDTAAPANVGAYALTTVARRLNALAQFSFRQQVGVPTPETIEIQAVAVTPELGVLGGISPTTVDLPSPGRTSDPVLVKLPAPRLHQTGVGRYDVSWDWQFRPAGSSEWTTFDRSVHVVYVTLAPPAAPWTQERDAAAKRNWPWTRLLDFACEWASGVTLASGLNAATKRIATKVEAGIFSLGEQEILAYDRGSNANFITGTTTRVFKATRFIRVLEGDAGERPVEVYCEECATAVAVVANALGADLTLVRVRRQDNQMMPLNRIVVIGRNRSTSPSFRFHEITVRAAARGQQVFDGCLQPDWDTNLRNEVNDFQLTKGRRLGGLRVNGRGTSYLQRLLEPRESLWERMEIVESAMPFLDVRPVFEPVIGEEDKLKILFRQRIDTLSPEMEGDFNVPPVIQAFKFPGFRLYKQADSMSHLEELRPLVVDYAGFAYTAFRKDQQGPDFDPDRRFRISVAWSRSAANAREAMAWLMTRNDRPLARLRRPGKKPLGDVAFATPGQRTVFIVRGNAFARLVSTGRKLVPMGPIADRLDRAVLKLRRAGQLGSIERSPDGRRRR